MLEAAMQSLARNQRVSTPHLEFAYAARDFRAMRETGASWKILANVPETMGITPIGRN